MRAFAATLLAAALGVCPRAHGVPIPIGVDLGGALVPSNLPAVSADGRFVAFHSPDAEIVPGDTNFDLELPGGGGTRGSDVFVRDRAVCRTTRVSVASDGSEANGDSGFSQMSPDGRFVVFSSNARNLVAGTPANRTVRDLFLHDRATGLTERVSIGLGGALPNGQSGGAAVSRDGRSVVFTSVASNLVPGDTNGTGEHDGADVFLFDRDARVTRRLSLTRDGEEVDGRSLLIGMSADASRVLVVSTGALTPEPSDGAGHLFLIDTRTHDVSRIDVSSDGTRLSPDGASLSADGCVAAFSVGPVLAPPPDRLFLYDCATNTPILVPGIEGSFPLLSGDGRRIVLLVSPGALGGPDGGAFVHDRDTNETSPIAFGSEVLIRPHALSSDGRAFVTANPVVVHTLGSAVPFTCELPDACDTGDPFPASDLLCPLATWRHLRACEDVELSAAAAAWLERTIERLRRAASGDGPPVRRSWRESSHHLRRSVRSRPDRRGRPVSATCLRTLRTLVRSAKRSLRHESLRE
jgi:hypothetical protein